MPNPTRHQKVENALRDLLAGAGMPQPDEAAQLRRAVVFLWYETKAFVLVDLDELPDDVHPLEGFDPELLAMDILGGPPEPNGTRPSGHRPEGSPRPGEA
jgi:hypothetical protein